MESFKRISYGVGITIAVSLFILFLISFVPNMVDQWDRDLMNFDDLDRDEALALLQEEPSYLAMHERFPDAVERFTQLDRNDGEMEVGVRNPDTGMTLVLHAYMHADVISHINVTCMDMAGDHREHVDGLFAEEFIRTTNCLDRVN